MCECFDKFANQNMEFNSLFTISGINLYQKSFAITSLLKTTICLVIEWVEEFLKIIMSQYGHSHKLILAGSSYTI